MKIVIADDSGFIKEMISHFLVNQGHEISGFASNGREVINLCNQLNPEILFLDLVMPDMNGVDAAIEVLKENPSLKIIVCSSLDQPWVEERTRNIGCSYFIKKPFSKSDLADAMDWVINNSRKVANV